MAFSYPNPLLRAARTINKLASTASFVVDTHELLRGDAKDKDMMERRWAASAVLLKNGEVAIVPAKDPVQHSDEDGWTIKVYSDGTFGPRTYWRNSDWVAENVADVYLGILTLPEGSGANSQHTAKDGTEVTISVVARDASDSVLTWKAGLKEGEETSELGALLGLLRPPSWMRRKRGQEGRKWLILDGDEDSTDLIQDLVSAYGEMGLAVDEVAGALDIAGIAGALATAR